MQARYYDPVIGRFYSNDPINAFTFLNQGNVHGFNRYAYANNNPYKYVDPDGMAGLPFNYGDLTGNNEGAQKATQIQNVVKKAVAKNTEALLVNTGKAAETAMILTPGGAKTKLATAVVSAGIKATASDTPLETFGQEMAAEALGKGIGDKIGSVTKALPDIPGLDSAASDAIKDVAGSVATDAAKSAIKDEFVEEQ